MALKNLADWLILQPELLSAVESLTAHAALTELGSAITPALDIATLQHDWRYLLLSASILAVSDDGNCQATALRIAQSCLQSLSTTARHRDTAAVILDMLSNHPALAVAVKKKLIVPDLQLRLPPSARLEWTRRSIMYSIAVGKQYLRLNPFQRRFWTEIQTHDWLSFSAPTSAGKSFIVTQWVSEALREKQNAVVVYIVPTRALISQVEADFKHLLLAKGIDANVSSVPIVRSFAKDRRNIFVFTQERLHIFMTALGNLSVDALIVDEAHKVGDRQRGVLLQQVIERIIRENPTVRSIFASPMTSNPETLLADARDVSAMAFVSEQETVNQNLYWVSQVPRKPREWFVSVCLSNSRTQLGTLIVPAVPSPPSKRLPFVAFAIGRLAPGNVVYVNTAAEAEKLATQLYDLIGAEGSTDNSAINALIDFCERIVHKEFLLAKVLRRGIAFHYGNLPLLIRAEIERLFSAGEIRFLICTSTLIEGVNMACRNIFLRGPRKGRTNPMSVEDFWNLAGRAGRWGKELQGNIFCVDATKADVWGAAGPPTKRSKYSIKRTSDTVLNEPEVFIAFLKEQAPAAISQKNPEFETVFSYLANIRARFGSVAAAPWADRYNNDTLQVLDQQLADALKELQIPGRIIENNPGVSPLGMNRLLLLFRERTAEGKPLEEFLPADPASEDAPESYAAVFGRLAATIAPKLAPVPPVGFMLALLVTKWMRGYPLARLIVDRINWAKKNKRSLSTAKAIRSIMEDVEQIARFEAPRALACYKDVLQLHLDQHGRAELIGNIPNFSVLLEYGVGQQTQVSLISAGLSRSTAVAISEIIAADNYGEDQVLAWLKENEKLWRESDLPELAKREISNIVGAESASTQYE
jgi:superfamily II DNA/RNA helicase